MPLHHNRFGCCAGAGTTTGGFEGSHGCLQRGARPASKKDGERVRRKRRNVYTRFTPFIPTRFSPLNRERETEFIRTNERGLHMRRFDCAVYRDCHSLLCERLTGSSLSMERLVFVGITFFYSFRYLNSHMIWLLE